ncbi:DeoR/GlpR transcriptional regulator [Mycolicibacterium sp. P1-18]|uniref:DeoR/GlpR family DNA-binding transcription regulator n=1 Tax=Mycolicibacterium sp. P1-18 TaxID=2024615 RepID=UPI0011F2B784|nr:DeoR/GlpR family DNA-binding transcription regulator [Mycolicibacterium sp. P1-18]KAA0098721.1 DeoR/GlpR transcriptional regulator [Mycolicibacterium sp. P1-18]
MSRTWFADERHAEVLRLLAEQGRVESAGLAARFEISAESVRKDLALLEERGLLRRVHGGAVPCEPSRAEPHVADRGVRVAEKSSIARRALRFVPEGGSLLLDAGSTTLRLAEMLPTDRGLVVYTNSWPVGAALHARGVEVVALGGRIRPATMAAVGMLTGEALAAVNVDVAFLGTNALSFDRGLTTPDPEEAAVKNQMLSAARQRIFLVDSGKFGRVSHARHATLDDVDVLITDDGASAEHHQKLRAAGVTVEVAVR